MFRPRNQSQYVILSTLFSFFARVPFCLLLLFLKRCQSYYIIKTLLVGNENLIQNALSRNELISQVTEKSSGTLRHGKMQGFKLW